MAQSSSSVGGVQTCLRDAVGDGEVETRTPETPPPGRFHRAPENTGPAGDRRGPSSMSLNEALELGDPGRAPVLLLWGSTSLSRSGWGAVAKEEPFDLHSGQVCRPRGVTRACRCDNRITVPSQVSRNRYMVGKYLPNNPCLPPEMEHPLTWPFIFPKLPLGRGCGSVIGRFRGTGV